MLHDAIVEFDDAMPKETLNRLIAVGLGLDRIVALYYRSSTLYHIH